MIRFFDASVLVKRYVAEPESAVARRLFASSVPAVTRLSEIEVVSAFARRTREGALTPAECDAVIAAFRDDLDGMTVVELTDGIALLASDLLRRHPLRSGDAVQLATCMYLARETGTAVPLSTFDDRLAAAAPNEGVPLAWPLPRARR